MPETIPEFVILPAEKPRNRNNGAHNPPKRPRGFLRHRNIMP